VKVLIISHTPITSYEAMGKTFTSLFGEFKKEELCQFFIHPSLPNVDYCNSYFRITDKDVLKSYFKFFKVNSREILPCDIDTKKKSLFENSSDESFYKNPKNRGSSRVLLRDLMWKMTRWYTKELDGWVKKEKPDCIFVAPGNAKFIYDVAIKISKKFNLPIVTYICDENYFVNNINNILDKLRLRLIRQKTRQLMERTSHIVTICETLTELYSKEFLKPTTTLMTGSSFVVSEKIHNTNEVKNINFLGNIACKRYLSLADIGETLEKINREYNKEFLLNVYTGVKNEVMLSHLRKIKTIKLHGHITGEEFSKVFHSSDVLIHTEAFDKESIEMVKNSVSTKIADSLASGILLFAYGPEQVASMKHLIDNNCAVTATDKEELYNGLKTALFDFDYKKEILENALKTAEKYHDTQKVSRSLYEICKELS